MSHITHLYHLSALDFINTSGFPGMPPWTPSYTDGSLDGSTGAGSTLVVHYVQALEKRRKLHTAGALFSGRQPIQNAMVPGGVSTLLSTTTPDWPAPTDYDQYGPFNLSQAKSKFKALLYDVRTFINTKYIPDVITVASVFSAFWSQGVGCQRLLSYGDYPVTAQSTFAGGALGTQNLLIKRGIVELTTPASFNQANIREFVENSYYSQGVLEAVDFPNGRHPFEGSTVPDMSSGYSWAKSPRYFDGTNVKVCEVGPLARMVVTHSSGNQIPVSEADMSTADSLGHILNVVDPGNYGTDAPLSTYNASTLVVAALNVAVPGGSTALLYSALGRHAARALEAKYVADAMAGTSGAITSWIDQINADNPGYTYKKIPKQIATGYGLTEAPRGALGHWIKISGKKVMRYQCVVPTTWNISPAVTGSIPTDNGPIEDCLIGSTIGTAPTDQVVNILRLIHPFDICIACAVHVVNPEGKEIGKFTIDPDGRAKNIEINK